MVQNEILQKEADQAWENLNVDTWFEKYYKAAYVEALERFGRDSILFKRYKEFLDTLALLSENPEGGGDPWNRSDETEVFKRSLFGPIYAVIAQPQVGSLSGGSENISIYAQRSLFDVSSSEALYYNPMQMFIWSLWGRQDVWINFSAPAKTIRHDFKLSHSDKFNPHEATGSGGIRGGVQQKLLGFRIYRSPGIYGTRDYNVNRDSGDFNRSSSFGYTSYDSFNSQWITVDENHSKTSEGPAPSENYSLVIDGRFNFSLVNPGSSVLSMGASDFRFSHEFQRDPQTGEMISGTKDFSATDAFFNVYGIGLNLSLVATHITYKREYDTENKKWTTTETVVEGVGGVGQIGEFTFRMAMDENQAVIDIFKGQQAIGHFQLKKIAKDAYAIKSADVDWGRLFGNRSLITSVRRENNNSEDIVRLMINLRGYVPVITAGYFQKEGNKYTLIGGGAGYATHGGYFFIGGGKTRSGHEFYEIEGRASLSDSSWARGSLRARDKKVKQWQVAMGMGGWIGGIGTSNYREAYVPTFAYMPSMQGLIKGLENHFKEVGATFQFPEEIKEMANPEDIFSSLFPSITEDEGTGAFISSFYGNIYYFKNPSGNAVGVSASLPYKQPISIGSGVANFSGTSITSITATAGPAQLGYHNIVDVNGSAQIYAARVSVRPTISVTTAARVRANKLTGDVEIAHIGRDGWRFTFARSSAINNGQRQTQNSAVFTWSPPNATVGASQSIITNVYVGFQSKAIGTSEGKTYGQAIIVGSNFALGESTQGYLAFYRGWFKRPWEEGPTGYVGVSVGVAF